MGKAATTQRRMVNSSGPGQFLTASQVQTQTYRQRGSAKYPPITPHRSC